MGIKFSTIALETDKMKKELCGLLLNELVFLRIDHHLVGNKTVLDFVVSVGPILLAFHV